MKRISKITLEEKELPKVDLPEETIERLIGNEYQMDSVGTNEIEIPIVEPKEQDVADSSVEEIEEVVEEVEYNDIEFPARGLNSLEEAIDFMHKPYFKAISKYEQEEYKAWLFKK